MSVRAYLIGWALVAAALIVFAVDTCAYRARAREVVAQVASVRADADALDQAVQHLRADSHGAYLADAIRPRADANAQRLGAVVDRARDLPGAMRTLRDLLPSHVHAQGGCGEHAFDVAGGARSTWTFACPVTAGKQVVIVVGGTVTATRTGAADVVVTCEDCGSPAGTSRPQAAWHAIGDLALRLPVVPRGQLLRGQVTFGCPADLGRCSARVTARVE